MAVIIPLFGIKFCRDDEQLPTNATWKDIVSQLVSGYPFWLWILTFLVFQPCIVHIVDIWIPSAWINIHCEWISQITDFVAMVTFATFAILLKITDENGKLKPFKKSE